jgi:hypothetical protein
LAAVAAERTFGRKCGCGGRLHELVEIVPTFNGSPVTYYSCGQCTQVVIREK